MLIRKGEKTNNNPNRIAIEAKLGSRRKGFPIIFFAPVINALINQFAPNLLFY